jgi:PAS domain S-box-containing protein
MPQENTKVHPLEEFINSESFATKVLNASLNGLYVYDVKLGKNIFINEEYTKLTGYTLCELQAMDDTQFFARFHPEDTERVSDHLQKIVFNNVEVQEIEYRFKTKNGRWIWCFSRDSIFARNKDGSVSQLLGTFFDITRLKNDITERKRAEEALRQNEQKYRVLFNTFPLGITVSDHTGRIVESNAMAEKLLGLPKKEHEARRIDGDQWRIIRPDETPMPANEYASVRALKEKRQIENVEMGIVKTDTETTWINVSAAPLHLEKHGVVVTYNDITPRKKAEQEYKTLFREMLDGFALHEIICDDSGTPVDYRFLDINPAFERMTGLKAESVVGRTVMDVLPGTEIYWIETYGAVALSGDPITFENHSAEIEKHFQVTAFSPAPNQFACIFLDITERKRAEENLQRLNKKLEEKVTERTQVAKDRAKKLQTLVGELTIAEQKERQRIAKILHDHLQQLLVGARINSEILCRSFGEKHNKIAQNVFDLINQSIQTSRSLTAELYPPVLQQGLSAVLKWTVRWMSENHGLTIDLQIDPDIEPKKEDITAFLYQSTRELLLNVIKHSGVKSARLEMSCDEEQKQLRVTVSDRGAGFDTGAVLKNEGTGFGLFSIHERLQLMGGTILIESSPGNGASFSLIVPLESKEEKEDEVILEIKTEDKITKTDKDKIRTLVVDDHAVVRQGISALLSFHSDIELVGEAGDGQEAVEKARQLHPDVILMDINMPKMDGIQATQIIHSELPYVRIIGLSIHDKEDQGDQMIQAGASAYCAKDGSTDEILSEIRRSD